MESVRNVALYGRISGSEHQKLGFSLENQREAMERFAQSKFRKPQLVSYADSESGFSSDRKDFQRLLADCRTGKIDAVLVWRIDRLMRNTVEGLLVLTELTVKLKMPVYSVTEGEIDFTDANSKFVSTMHLNIAEMERQRLLQRVMPGMKKGAKSGRYQGARNPAYGTTYDKKEKLYSWIPAETKVVKLIFDRVASGESIHSVARYIHKCGYRNRTGRAMGIKLIGDIIKREMYCDGYYRWHGEISDAPVLKPIIARSKWEEANRVVKTHRTPGSGAKRGSRRTDSKRVLQGVLKCIHCEANMVGHPARKGVPYYICGTYCAKTKAACKGQWIKAEPIEAQAFEILKRAVSNKVIIGLAREEMRRIMADRNPALLDALRLSERELKDTKARFRSLLTLHHAGTLTVEQFKSANDELITDQQKLEANIRELETRRESAQSQAQNSDKMLALLERFEEIYPHLEPASKKALFNHVFERVHAVCEGRWKPKRIRDFELKEPFKRLLDERWQSKKITAKNGGDRSGIQSRPLAAR